MSNFLGGFLNRFISRYKKRDGKGLKKSPMGLSYYKKNKTYNHRQLNLINKENKSGR